MRAVATPSTWRTPEALVTSLLLAVLLSTLAADARPLRIVVAPPPPPPVVVLARGPARPDVVWVPAQHVHGRVVPGHWQRVGPPPRARLLPPAPPRVRVVVAPPPAAQVLVAPPPAAPQTAAPQTPASGGARVLVRQSAAQDQAAEYDEAAEASGEAQQDAPLAIPVGD